MTINFTAATEYKGKQSRNVKRIQIHVVEAQGLLSAKGSARIPSAYVTVESPGLGTLHQTSSVGKGKRLVWHENTRIVELRPTAPIKFTVKRHALLPIGNQVLGSTATYDLSQLIEMQGKNDRETCVTLSLNSGTESPKSKSKSSPSLVINIRDLDTREKIEQVRESAVYAASIRSRSRDSASMSGESSPVSSRSLDFPTTPPLTADSSTFSYSLSAPTSPTLQSASLAYSPLPPRPTTTEAVAASVMSVAVASPASSQRKRSQTVPSLHEIIEEPRHY